MTTVIKTDSTMGQIRGTALGRIYAPCCCDGCSGCDGGDAMCQTYVTDDPRDTPLIDIGNCQWSGLVETSYPPYPSHGVGVKLIWGSHLRNGEGDPTPYNGWVIWTDVTYDFWVWLGPPTRCHPEGTYVGQGPSKSFVLARGICP